ncbi:MAG: redoxin domain-containing protein [Pseudomonadales bacterium]|nr:redoxin domain-containing protein [Pseudomonadales bacterium]MCP5345075.1 redoxin domain-containing protein [Pseudomonadales bacterium]
MKYFQQLFLLLLIASPASAMAARDIPDFALLDHQGAFHQLSRYADERAVVLYSFGVDCDVSTAALDKLSILNEKYAGRGVRIFLLDAMPDEGRGQVRALLSDHHSDIPVLMDTAQLVSHSLEIVRTGEVLVVEPRTMSLIYRGAIDSRAVAQSAGVQDRIARNYLDEVLSSLTHNGPEVADVPWQGGHSIPYGDALEADTRVSYVNDVVPVLERRCVSCHSDGGVAPWSMDSYQMVSGWSAMIRETLLTLRMPPGQIDDTYLDNFVDVHSISDQEKRTLVHWIDQGALVDGEVDPLTELAASSSGWALGEPDLIVEFPPQEIPASGVLDYKFEPVEIGLDRDRWVRAYEFDIGDPAVLHHVVTYTQDEKQQKQNPSGGGSRTNFGGYAPGREYVAFDENTGILLQKDMRFMVQFHYTTVGRPVVDVTRIGLYFQDEEPEFPLSRTAVMNGEFVIPPGDADFAVNARASISKDSFLYNIAPHMHFRGKRVKYRVEYPDGTMEELLSIPNFQHNWQMVYRLKEPKFLPAGSVVVAEGAFDNSAGNPLNPDPSQEVRWGEQVWDEMFIAWMRVSEAH